MNMHKDMVPGQFSTPLKKAHSNKHCLMKLFHSLRYTTVFSL